jgi:hypothetical protein
VLENTKPKLILGGGAFELKKKIEGFPFPKPSHTQKGVVNVHSKMVPFF